MKSLFKIVFFLIIAVNIQAGESCDQILYDTYLEYRECINHDSCDVVSKYYSTKQSAEFIKTSIVVDHDTVAIEKYYEVCKEKEGELFLRIVRADGTAAHSVIDFEIDDRGWVMIGEQLFTFSDLLGIDFMAIDDDSLSETNIVLVKGYLLECLSSFIGTNRRYINYDEYLFKVNSCY